MGHGPNSSYIMMYDMMYVLIVKCQEEMAKIHSYQDTCLSRLKICWYDFFR